MRVRLRPDDEHVGDRRIGDPHLGAGEDDSRPATFWARVRMLPGSEPASGSVRPKQPTHSPVASLGRYFLRCSSDAVGVDRVHHEARLDRHRRAVAAVDALDRAGDQAVADVAEAGAAIFVRDGRAEQAELAHLAHDLAVETLVEIGRGHARLQLLLRIAFGRVADEPLLVGQLVIEIERIRPVERQDGRLAHVRCAPLSSEVAGALTACGAARHPRRQSFLATFAPPLPPKLCFSVSPTLMCRLRSRNSSMMIDGLGAVGEEQQAVALAVVLNALSTSSVIEVFAARAIFDERGPSRRRR